MKQLASELAPLRSADLAHMLEKLPLRSFFVDGEGVIRWLSAVAVADLGDRTGRSWMELIPAEQHENVAAAVGPALKRREPAEFTVELEESDGRLHRRDVSVVPLHDGGSLIGLFGVAASDAGTVEVARAAPGAPLTRRQLEILQLLADGRSTDQIAATLHLSAATVRNHITHLLANLGVHTRIHAVLVAIRIGLVRL